MPRLKKRVEMLIKKARESSILAVNVYNNPGTVFRSNGYVVLMTIAWTSLFHAIFERDKVSYYYKDKNDKRKYIYIDGDKKAWELKHCVKHYYKESNNSIRKNVEFMIGIRNKIEHRFAPEIDTLIYGECQANLINFEEILVNEFSEKFSLADTLYFALQHSKIRSDEQLKAAKNIQSNYLKDIKGYIDNYRRNLSDEVISDPKYSFRVFLIPKPANREKNADVTLEFINYDHNSPTEMEKYENILTLIKEKKVEVSASLTADEASKYIFVDRKNQTTGVPVVGITDEISKANGILLREQLSDTIFDDPTKIGEAALILAQKINEFPLSERALYSIYVEREKIQDENAVKVFLEGSFSQSKGTYGPIYYWLKYINHFDFVEFVHLAFITSNSIKINALNRLFIASGDLRWISFIEEIGLSYQKRFTQAFQWVWTLKDMIDDYKKSKKEPIYSIRDIYPSKRFDTYTTKQLVDNNDLAKAVLSSSLMRFSLGESLDRSAVRQLDLISHFKELSIILPEPPAVQEYLASSIFKKDR